MFPSSLGKGKTVSWHRVPALGRSALPGLHTPCAQPHCPWVPQPYREWDPVLGPGVGRESDFQAQRQAPERSQLRKDADFLFLLRPT